MIAPCSASSRTLRAGCAGAAERPPGRRLRAALCREAGRDEGMAVQSNKGMVGLGDGWRLCGCMIGFEQHLAVEQRAEHVE